MPSQSWDIHSMKFAHNVFRLSGDPHARCEARSLTLNSVTSPPTPPKHAIPARDFLHTPMRPFLPQEPETNSVLYNFELSIPASRPVLSIPKLGPGSAATWLPPASMLPAGSHTPCWWHCYVGITVQATEGACRGRTLGPPHPPHHHPHPDPARAPARRQCLRGRG